MTFSAMYLSIAHVPLLFVLVIFIQFQTMNKSLTMMGNRGRGEGGGRKEGGRRTGGRSGIPKVEGSRRNRGKLRNIPQYFAIKKVQRCWRQQNSVGTALTKSGNFKPHCPPTPQSVRFPTLLLFIMLYEVILIFDSVAEILKCDHSIDSFDSEQYCSVAADNLLCRTN